ncbi:MAG TPA: hypothetical protein DIV86_06600 [Alphaproteobacteria bacterium]|nr:hypothetical protein [Alphaproteobacteria bacterium]
MNISQNDDKILSTEFLDQLKIIREQKEISIDEIAEKTNIKPQYIRAIEEADLASLPGGVYNKAYIRSVAEFLGVNIRQFEKAVNIGNFNDNTRVKVEFGRNISKIKPNKMIVLLSLILVCLLYFSFFDKNKQPLLQNHQKLEGKKISPVKTEVKKISNRDFTVSIIALKETNIKIKNIYSEVIRGYNLKAFETIILNADEEIYADVSNINNLEIYLNGILVPNVQSLVKEGTGYNFSVNSLFKLIQNSTKQNAANE